MYAYGPRSLNPALLVGHLREYAYDPLKALVRLYRLLYYSVCYFKTEICDIKNAISRRAQKTTCWQYVIFLNYQLLVWTRSYYKYFPRTVLIVVVGTTTMRTHQDGDAPYKYIEDVRGVAFEQRVCSPNAT